MVKWVVPPEKQTYKSTKEVLPESYYVSSAMSCVIDSRRLRCCIAANAAVVLNRFRVSQKGVYF